MERSTKASASMHGPCSRTALSYINSPSSQQMLPKGRSSTSSKGYKRPNGLFYVSTYLALRYWTGTWSTSQLWRTAPRLFWPPRGNILFSKADLVVILLASVPNMLQKQYNHMHSTVPEAPCTLLLDLENIKCTNVKVKATTACASDGGSSDGVPKKACAKKFCLRCKT